MSTNAAGALAALRARLEGDATVTMPMYWRGDDAPILPDDPAPFAYLVFNNEGSGAGPAGFGGGRGRNLYRNRALVEAFVFSPAGEGEAIVLAHAETIAASLRSFRNSAVSCFSADVIPVGPGSKVAPPGFVSEVSNYQCAVAEIELHFDQIG
ncbi:hypothetical protein RPMA_12440 [Tardiphaga alba]|uniref:DUF3168 domain-containing protein n=1 Tax=Tardiphaga alba TaxID=340268 RepID=A0ABX8A748_9BRAD|nr:hypothetical protein [Tardiphaga alba]QUS39554.1 hypothetical protein RPMA_12440 [Tardiphaga alba]